MWAELVVNYDHFFVLMDLKRLHHCDKPTTGGRQFSARLPQAAGRKTNTLAARGLEECASFPDFCNNRQFHDVIYCVYSRLCTLFRRISYLFMGGYPKFRVKMASGELSNFDAF